MEGHLLTQEKCQISVAASTFVFQAKITSSSLVSGTMKYNKEYHLLTCQCMTCGKMFTRSFPVNNFVGGDKVPKFCSKNCYYKRLRSSKDRMPAKVQYSSMFGIEI